MNNEQLLPCAHCGTEAAHDHAGVWCENETCTIYGLLFKDHTAWNRRALSPSAQTTEERPYAKAIRTGEPQLFSYDPTDDRATVRVIFGDGEGVDFRRDDGCGESAQLQVSELRALPAHVTKGFSRTEWHTKAWNLFHAKTFDDTMLSKVNMHTVRAVFDATFDALQSAQPVPSVPEELAAIGNLIATQDNRITDAPIFIVQQKRSYITDDDYYDCYYEWRETESGDYVQASPQKRVHLEKYYKENHCEPKGWKRYAMHDVWEFVTACFTEQGCIDYLKRDGHNLKEPRIYAEGSYRNEEYRTVRNWLMLIAAAPQTKEGEA